MIDNQETSQAFALFQNWLKNRSFFIHYQPIISLKDGSTYGYEALTRFPDNDIFSHPGELFNFANSTNSLYDLEKVTRELAIQSISKDLYPHEKLWINLTPEVIYDEAFTTGYTRNLLNECGLKADQIVFEITERSAIEDFIAFKDVLQHYRKQGFLIAIDDAGAGYSSLEAITELQPDFIKIDRSLINGIHESFTRQYMLEALLQLSEKMRATVIAEGVELSEELECIGNLGVHYAQGFFLARPNFPVPIVNPGCLDVIQKIIPSNYADHTITENTTFFDLLQMISRFKGRFDTSWVKMDVPHVHSVIPLTEVIQFITHIQCRGSVPLNQPIWSNILEYRAQSERFIMK